MDEVEVKATALHHFKKQAKGIKTTKAALKFLELCRVTDRIFGRVENYWGVAC